MRFLQACASSQRAAAADAAVDDSTLLTASGCEKQARARRRASSAFVQAFRKQRRLAAFSMVFCSRCLIFLFYVMCHVLLSDACAFCRLVRRRKERQPCQPLILLSVKSSSAMFSHTT
jgi:hypothetical protein